VSYQGFYKNDNKIPRFASSAGTIGRSEARQTGVNKSSAISFLVNLLEVDDEFIEIMLRVRENLGTKECKDVIRYHRWRFVLKVCVIDSELRVKPVDLVSD
jgi:hypothetical protein